MKVRMLLATFASCAVLFSVISTIPLAQAGPFRDYSTFIAAFKKFVDAYPTLATYETIGKTVENRDIIMFKIGNPDGGRVLFDGAMHGWESLGGEVLFSYAKWLLTSNDSLAKSILAKHYTLLVPAVNADRYNIGRKNANGVDLNRNFATNWNHGNPDPNSDSYRGPAPLSEPESQAMVRLFQSVKPDFYVSLHGGSTELFASSYGNKTYYSTLGEKITVLDGQRGVTPYYFSRYLSSPAFAICDAAKAGIISFLLEASDQSTISLSEIETVVLPKFIPVAGVLSQEARAPSSYPYWDLNQDGQVDTMDLALVTRAFGSTPGFQNWNPQADVNLDIKVDMRDVSIVARHFGDK